MAHELEMIDGEASMAYSKSGGLPWHSLGTEIPDDLTPEQILVAAKLDWKVEKRPMYIEVAGKMVDTGKRALVRDRDDRFMSVVSDSWKPCQNDTAFEFFNDFVANGDMKMDTAGALRNGEIVWGLAKINESFDLFGGDKVDGYLLFSNPHQFGKTIQVQTVCERVVCANTLAIALSENSKYHVKVNHSRDFDGDKVKEILGISKGHLESYKMKAEFLGSKRYKEEDIVEYFARVFGMNENKNELRRPGMAAMELLETQAGAEFAPGTYWSLFNATTNYTNHEAGRNLDNRAFSLLHGSNRDINLKALNVALEMADA